MTKDEVYKKVQGVLVEALGVDEEEVTPHAGLRTDLGAESIDFLDIQFRLEKAFTTDPSAPFQIPRNDLFPEDLETMQNDPRFVVDGKVTPEGLSELKRRMPFADLTDFEKDPQVDKAGSLLTVDTITRYMASRLGVAA
jgi:acyl carrier protein